VFGVLLLSGIICESSIKYVMPADRVGSESSRKDVGDIHVQWTMKGDYSHVRQFDVTWRNLATGAILTKSFDPETNKCLIPVNQRR